MRKLPPIEERCPQCDYSLKGLPDNHHCPECGLDYETRGFQIFKQPKPQLLQAAVTPILLCAWFAYTFVTTSKMFARVVTVVGIVWMLLMVWGWRRRRWQGNRAGLSSGELVLLPDDGPPQRFLWQEIGTIRRPFLESYLVIHSPDGMKLAVIPVNFLGSNRRQLMFLDAANKWLTRYRAEHSQEDA